MTFECADPLTRQREMADGLDGVADIATGLAPDVAEDGQEEDEKDEAEIDGTNLAQFRPAFLRFSASRRDIPSSQHPGAEHGKSGWARWGMERVPPSEPAGQTPDSDSGAFRS